MIHSLGSPWHRWHPPELVALVGHPYARKLEAIVGTFEYQIQLEAMNAAIETSITDYFHRNEYIEFTMCVEHEKMVFEPKKIGISIDP